MKNSRKPSASGRGQDPSQGGSSKAKPATQTKPWVCLTCENAIDEDNVDVTECHGCKEWCHKPCTDLTGALETEETSFNGFVLNVEKMIEKA